MWMELASSPNVIIWELCEHCELSDLLVGPHIVRARGVPRETPKPDRGFSVLQWPQEAADFMVGTPKQGSR